MTGIKILTEEDPETASQFFETAFCILPPEALNKKDRASSFR